MVVQYTSNSLARKLSYYRVEVVAVMRQEAVYFVFYLWGRSGIVSWYFARFYLVISNQMVLYLVLS